MLLHVPIKFKQIPRSATQYLWHSVYLVKPSIPMKKGVECQTKSVFSPPPSQRVTGRTNHRAFCFISHHSPLLQFLSSPPPPSLPLCSAADGEQHIRCFLFVHQTRGHSCTACKPAANGSARLPDNQCRWITLSFSLRLDVRSTKKQVLFCQ